jgi:hypothetical protein
MARSYPTLEQRRSNAAFSASRSGAPVGVKNLDQIKSGYVNAAKKLWQLSDDWEVNLLMNVFGPELMGSIACAFDPSVKFQVGGQKVDVARRRRTRETGSYVAGGDAGGTFKIYRNYVIDGEDLTIVPEFLFENGIYEDNFRLPQSMTSHTTFFEDSTDSLRSKGTDFNEMESCKVSGLAWDPAPQDTYTIRTNTTRYDPDFDGAYERVEEIVVFKYDKNSPVVPIVRGFGFDAALEDLHEQVKQFAADHLPDYLPQCLSSGRTFNAFYQLGELKDLPLMIRKTLDTQRYLLSLLKDPKTALRTLDKALADAHLNYLFGYKSIEQTIKSLLVLPEKVAKRFNYLLRKNSKRTSQRFTRTYDNVSELGSLWPSWTYLLPSGVHYEIVEETAKFVPNVEVRCVVNSTINFPQLAVPKFSDSNFRDMIGLNPRVVDIYNLVPWTWLGDWFTGVSKYLDLVETILLDKDLINVGFVTVLFKSDIALKGTFRIRDRDVVFDKFGHKISEVLGDPIDISYRTAGSMDYRTRFSIDDLFGVKSVSDKQGLLTESQKAILGSLSTKFTGDTVHSHKK